MKQVLSVLLAAALLLALAGCTVVEKKDALKLHEGVLDSEFTGLTLDVDVANITIEPGDAFRVAYSLGNEPQIETASDGTLTIRERAKDHWWEGIHFTSASQPYVTITVPEGTVLNKIGITADVGDVKVSGLEVGALHADTDVGDLTLQDVTVQGPMDFSADVGNVDCRETTVAGAVQIEIDTGDISFDGSAAGLDAETDVGNVKLLLPGPAENWAAQLQTDVGDVTVDGLDQGRQYQTRGGQYPLDAETDTGDITVEFK